MSEVSSTQSLAIGTIAPPFSLPDADGRILSLDHTYFHGASATVVAFVCNHCPYVVHLADAMGEMSREFEDRDVRWVAIMSNDVEHYPADAPEKMKQFATLHRWEFPYLYDESQEIAKTYHAACTPDFFVFDQDKKLCYRGQFDETRPRNTNVRPPTGDDLRNAIENTLMGEPPLARQLPASGCNIKWKRGNEPAYFSAS